MTTHRTLISIDDLIHHARENRLRCRRIRVGDGVDAYAFSGRGMCTIVVLGRRDNSLQLVSAGGTEVAVVEGRLAG